MANRCRVFVVGVGMTKFERPHSKQWDYPEMGREAAANALKDAKIDYSEVEAVVASYNYGDPTCGQKVVYELGLTGVPVFNVNNHCSAGSTALMMAKHLVRSGHGCVLAVGFEKMDSGLSLNFKDRVSPISNHIQSLHQLGATPGPLNPAMNDITSDVLKMFAYAAREHCSQHGTTVEHFAKISSKNHRHGAQNPRSCSQKPLTVEQVLARRVVCDPITVAMAAPTGDGGAAAILCNEEFVKKHNLEDQAVEILAQHMCTDLPSSFNNSYLNLCGYEMSRRAAELCYKETGLSPRDVDVLEVHDCFAPNELFLYEALGLCPEGKGGQLIDTAEWKANRSGGEVCYIGRQWVVNPSGGLESKGHPIGATGLAQCAELSWQLRGVAGKRQVDDARIGLQQNFGIGGAAVVTMYGIQPHTAGVAKAKL
ncbi:hypothetical protein EMCRGX_G033177 [Ephydatia muelleri]